LLFVFATRLLLFWLVTLAMATSRMTTPMTMSTSTAPMPSSHGQTLRLAGCVGGIGLHAGGGVSGGGAWSGR